MPSNHISAASLALILFCLSLTLSGQAQAGRMDHDRAFVIDSVAIRGYEKARILSYNAVPVNSGVRNTGVEVRGDRVFIVNNGRKYVKNGEMVAQLGDLGHSAPNRMLIPVKRQKAPEIEKTPRRPFFNRGQSPIMVAKAESQTRPQDVERERDGLKLPKIGQFIGKIFSSLGRDDSMAA